MARQVRIGDLNFKTSSGLYGIECFDRMQSVFDIYERYFRDFSLYSQLQDSSLIDLNVYV